VGTNVFGLSVLVKHISEIWSFHDWQCSNYNLQSNKVRYSALLLMSARHAVSALYIHTTMSAADPFRTLSTIDHSAHCQIFDYKSDSSHNNTNGSCYFLDGVVVRASYTGADRRSVWTELWAAGRNDSFGTRHNKNNRAETQERISGRIMSYDWYFVHFMYRH